jgi:hypothetical protein
MRIVVSFELFQQGMHRALRTLSDVVRIKADGGLTVTSTNLCPAPHASQV